MQQHPENEWIEWAGDAEAPVAYEDLLAIRFRDGKEVWARQYQRAAFANMVWAHDGTVADIVAYRLHTKATSK